jgi:hypothetical protein
MLAESYNQQSDYTELLLLRRRQSTDGTIIINKGAPAELTDTSPILHLWKQ